ncbi:MAG TPA: hypothetical protein VGM44_17545, partial [Polyangiaceae bacterium]
DRPWRKIVAGSLVAATLAVFTYHNVWVAYEDSLYNRRIATRAPSTILVGARAVADAAGPHAVVLADTHLSWALPTFGPKVLVLRHPNTLVPDEPDRDLAVGIFLSSSGADDLRRRIIAEYGVTHVLLNRHPGGTLARFLRESATFRALPSGYKLYTLNR